MALIFNFCNWNEVCMASLPLFWGTQSHREVAHMTTLGRHGRCLRDYVVPIRNRTQNIFSTGNILASLEIQCLNQNC